MTTMPTSYESSQTTTTTTSTGGGGDIRFRPEYIRTIPGILKIVEVVLAIVTFICASVWAPFEHIGGPWVQFVSMSAFITTLIIFFFYLFGVIYKFPAFWVLITLSMVVFICTCVWYWGPAQGWVQCVSITAFISTLVTLLLHLFNLISRFPGPWILIEFIYYCVYTLLFLIAAIVCAAKGSWHASIGAAAFFAFAATAVYAADTFFQFRAWRSGETEMTTATTNTTHTTTTTTTATTAEYKEAY